MKCYKTRMDDGKIIPAWKDGRPLLGGSDICDTREPKKINIMLK